MSKRKPHQKDITRIRHEAIEAALPEGQERKVFYSVPRDLDRLAVKGMVRFVTVARSVWFFIGDKENAQDYHSKVLTDPTWLDVAVAANQMIHTVKDEQHRFLEDIEDIDETDDGVRIFTFIMGS